MITTWNQNNFEYSGQCDLTLVKDSDFAKGLGLEIQIRTKLVRNSWSHVKSAAIKIGNDVLEFEGSADATVDEEEARYWINYEYQGELDSFAGFNVTRELSPTDNNKRSYTIDLSTYTRSETVGERPMYPGKSIVVHLNKEFVRVRIISDGDNSDEKPFENAVGLLGDYKTGKNLARDGTTVLDDFAEFGDEWQSLPIEFNIFHEVSRPQFPELCIKPEYPREQRK